MPHDKPPKDEVERVKRLRQQEILDLLPPINDLRIARQDLDFDCVDPDVAVWRVVEKEEERGKKFEDSELVNQFFIAHEEINRAALEKIFGVDENGKIQR